MASSLPSFLHGLKPFVLMVIARIIYAGSNILIKMSVNQGMNMRILLAYRYIFATGCIAPIAFFLERASLAENLVMESLSNTSATLCTAVTNLVPAITFLLAIIFRLERLEIKKWTGQAKILGTILGTGGAMLLTFYKGPEIGHGLTHFNSFKLNEKIQSYKNHDNQVLGALFAVGFCISAAVWLIIQTKMSKRYPCEYSSTALMCASAAVQSVVYALCRERDWSAWKLHFNIGLFTAIYMGVLASGLMVAVIAWCVRVKGPLYVSNFSPLTLIFVGVAELIFLNEKLYLGSILGAIVIVIGLYFVLWGKAKCLKAQSNATPSTLSAGSQELKTSFDAPSLTDV
ncbi:EamA domain, partial [Dillenia turbinata]